MSNSFLSLRPFFQIFSFPNGDNDPNPKPQHPLGISPTSIRYLSFLSVSTQCYQPPHGACAFGRHPYSKWIYGKRGVRQRNLEENNRLILFCMFFILLPSCILESPFSSLSFPSCLFLFRLSPFHQSIDVY
jgi:hypothetical protein